VERLNSPCLVLDGTGGKVKLTMFSSRWYWWNV